MYKSLTKHLELDGKFLIDENQVLLYKVVNTALYSKNFFFFSIPILSLLTQRS